MTRFPYLYEWTSGDCHLADIDVLLEVDVRGDGDDFSYTVTSVWLEERGPREPMPERADYVSESMFNAVMKKWRRSEGPLLRQADLLESNSPLTVQLARDIKMEAEQCRDLRDAIAEAYEIGNDDMRSEWAEDYRAAAY